MSDRDPRLVFLGYAEQELSYVHQLWEEFGRKYPETSEILNKDPHSRLLRETLAFLSARVRLKLDDDLPEVSDAILGLLYPHLLAPVPSMAMVQVSAPGRGRLTAPHSLAPKSRVLSPPDPQGVRCEFRTRYPVTVYPIDVTAGGYVRLGGSGLARESARVHLELTPHPGILWKNLQIESLRFFLQAEPVLAGRLHEAILRFGESVEIRGKDASGRDVATRLREPAAKILKRVGFGREDGLLPYSERSLLSYRVLQEFFVFPEKFHFFEIHGLAAIRDLEIAGPVTISIELSASDRDLEQLVRRENFQLGVTPAVNLFEKAMEPIRLNQRSYEYSVEPDRRSPEAYEVYSIEDVRSVDSESANVITYRPFYSLRHGEVADAQRCYWFSVRKPREQRKGDTSRSADYVGTDVYLSFVNDAFDRVVPADRESVSVRAVCTNRGRVVMAKYGPGTTGLRLEGEPGLDVRFATEPTKPVLPPLRGRSFWRLISTLAMNQLPISGTPEAKIRLQEILALHDFLSTPQSRDRIQGIASLDSRPVVRRVAHETGSGICRGVELRAQFDPNKFEGRSFYLFAAVLEQFLSSFASVNSFVQLVASAEGQPEAAIVWPPRLGERGIV